MKLSIPPSLRSFGPGIRSHMSITWGIQLTMRALVRADHSGLVMVWRFVTTGMSGMDGGGSSTFTVSDDVALVSPLSAVTSKTYSPAAENVAVVTDDLASPNVTLPGPDFLLQRVVAAGPVGLGGGTSLPRA